MTPGQVPVLVAAGGARWETDALRRVAASGPRLMVQKRCVDLRDLLATAGTGVSRAALVAERLPGLDADSLGLLARSGVGVVLVADGADAGGPGRVAYGSARVVAEDDLDQVASHLLGAVESAADAAPAPSPEESTGRDGRRGRIVAVWGPTGGPGRTTVAVGLAAEVSGGREGVLLLDADPYGGAVAQHLSVLEEVSGLLAGVRLANAGQLDGERLAALARQVGGRLRVITGLPRPDRWSEVRPQAFTDLLDQAARLEPALVVDLGFGLERPPADPFAGAAPTRNDMTLTALAEADDVVAVGSADPVGLARLARGLLELAEVTPGGPTAVVVNRMRPSLGWSERELRLMVEPLAPKARVHFLPDDRQAADRALMTGRSLVECGDSALRRAIAGLAEDVWGAEAGAVTEGRRPRRRRPQLASSR